MKHAFVILVLLSAFLNSFSQNEPVLKIGLIADPQYQDTPTVGERHYRESLWKLKEAIDTMNFNKVDFIQNLGDIINGEWRSYDSIIPVYKNANQDIEVYHLLGNHDFSVDSSQMKNILKTLSMPNFYYSYVEKGWRFIVLDATDYSYFANSVHNYDTHKIDAYFKQTEGKQNHYDWNGAIGKEQQVWLKSELKKAKKMNQKAILFSHMPIVPEHSTNLWNNKEIIKIVKKYKKTVAVFINGHRHEGSYEYKNGIHYIGVFGMLNTEINSYGILELYSNKLVLKGYGNQKNISFNIN
jgi:predicted phosphodiesterase